MCVHIIAPGCEDVLQWHTAMAVLGRVTGGCLHCSSGGWLVLSCGVAVRVTRPANIMRRKDTASVVRHSSVAAPLLSCCSASTGTQVRIAALFQLRGTDCSAYLPYVCALPLPHMHLYWYTLSTAAKPTRLRCFRVWFCVIAALTGRCRHMPACMHACSRGDVCAYFIEMAQLVASPAKPADAEHH